MNRSSRTERVSKLWMLTIWLWCSVTIPSLVNADELEILKPSDGQSGDYFGMACDMTGTHAIIGNSPEESAGQAYVFKKSDPNTWTEQSILSAPSPELFDEFGYSVAIDGDYIAVSSTGYDDSEGAVYIFKQVSDNWSLLQPITQPEGSQVQYFGEVVRMKGDYLVIATPYDDGTVDNGKVFLYKRSGDVWNLLKTFTAPASVPEAGDFGYWVDISDNFLIISAPAEQTTGNGQAFIYAKNSDSWDLAATLTPPNGYYGCGVVVALSDTYAALTVLSDNEEEEFSSAVVVFQNTGGTWAQSQLIKAPAGLVNMFGYALSINDTNFAISDPLVNFVGAIYRYTLSGAQWTLQETYNDPQERGFPSLGSSVAVFNNDYLLAGYPLASLERGEAYLWRLDSSYITIHVDPVAGGTTDPVQDTQHQVTSNVAFAIKATANSGYAFNGWVTNSGTVAIADPQSANTTATVNGNAVITAEFVPVASVSFNVSPVGGGTTSPDGTQKYAKGTRVPIKAVPAEGYYFSEWIASGSVIIDNPLSVSTTALVSGDCSIAAVFQPFVKEVQLTMMQSPDNGGTVQPSLGTHVVESTKSFNLIATPASGMHFVKWSISGSGAISDPLSSSTTAAITEDSTITGFFAQNSTMVTLTMATTPANGGETSPAAGDVSVNANQPTRVEATPASGYHFVNWSISGSGSIDGSANVVAWVTLSGNATVTATFAENSQAVDLTMAISPGNGGNTNPGTGVHRVNVGETYNLTAVPSSGFYFVNWQVKGDAKVSNPALADTLVSLNADATVTAIFAEATETAKLTIQVSPQAGGTTNPGAGEHTVVVGSSQKLTAIPESGYYFSHWGLSGKAVISDTNSAETILTLYGQTVITAYFVEITSTAVLTMQLTPDNGGVTNPGAGTHTVNVGQSFALVATPAEGFLFERWQVTGGAVVEDLELSETEAVLNSDATVTAVFAAEGETAQLILAVDPVEGGATNPGIGIHTVPVNEKLTMEALPAAGYYFVSWESDKNIEIEDRFAEKTAVELSGNTTLVAVFKEKTATVELTMAISRDSFGTTSPGVGTHAVEYGDKIRIEAIAETGYHFTGWTVSDGDAEIDNLIDKDTYVTPLGNATVTAWFAADEVPVTLTMAVTPDQSGFTSPGSGEHQEFYAGQIVDIQAFPADGYHFVRWQADGANIAEELALKTQAVLVDDAVITAVFDTNDEVVTLVVINSDINGGLTYPVPGAHLHYAGESIRLEAAPFDNYYFIKWELDGDGVIDDDKAAITHAVLSENSTITAIFSQQQAVYLAKGSIVSIDASGYDDSRKWVYATYYNTRKSETVPRKDELSNVVFDKENKIITGEWRRGICLYNASDYPRKEKLSELLIANPVQDLKLYGIYVNSRGQEAVLTGLIGYIVPPVVDAISGDYQEKDDVFIVEGRFFGANVPSVMLEYTTARGAVRYKRCKVLKTESLRYMNAQRIENKSCMKVWDSDKVDSEDVGYSQISVVYPKLGNNVTPTGYIIVKNSSGMAPGKFPETQED